MSEPLRFVPPRVAFVDPRSGLITREWYLFLQGVFNRIGGAGGPSTDDISGSLFEDAGSSETNALLFELGQSLGQAPSTLPHSVENQLQTEINELRDTIAELRKDIESMQQGPTL